MMSSNGTVPKFASFKPKATSTAIQGERKREDGDRSRHSRDKSERRHHHHRHHRSRSRETSHRPSSESSTVPEKPRESLSSLFVIDRKGDIQNVIYGSVHKYSVPPFHRIGAGHVLGAPRSMKIDRNHTSSDGIILSSRDHELAGKREKYAFSRNEKQAPRLLRIRTTHDTEDAVSGNASFISFQTSRKRKRSGSTGSVSSDDEKKDYRSIEGKAKAPTGPVDEALEYVSDSDSSGSESGRTIRFNEAMRQTSIDISRRVDEHPEDIQAWLDLIQHQDSLLGLGDTGYRKVTNAERRSTADIKIHMYEKAIEKAGSILWNRERLLLGLMKEGAKVWDFKTHSQRWENILQDNLNSLELWKKYLDFRQSAFQTFRFEEVRDIYLKRIRLLTEALSKKQIAEPESRALYEQLVYTVLRATLFMREAGYVELGVAVWQALLEFNFCKPDTLPLSTSDPLDLFKEFWESEVPRIGENGATGWKSFVPDRDTDLDETRTDAEIPSAFSSSGDIFDGWTSAELFRAKTSARPARTMDDVAEDDPYRVILWSDIEGFMIDMASESPVRNLRWLLLDAFLLFYRLPPIPSTDSTSQEWWADTFIRDELIEWDRSHVDAEFIMSTHPPQKSIDMGDLLPQEFDGLNSLHGRIAYFSGSLETLIPLPREATYFVPWNSRNGNLEELVVEPLNYPWIRNTLQSLVNVEKANDDLTEYYLGLQWCNEPQNVKKNAKSLLKERPSSLRLYTAYALIEWLRGNQALSTNVFDAALGMRKSLPEVERIHGISLCKTQAWCLLSDEDRSGALKCLWKIPDMEPSTSDLAEDSPALLLKVRNHLVATQEYLLSNGNLRGALACTECLSMLEYLTAQSKEGLSKDQGNITAALTLIDKFSSSLTSRYRSDRSIFHELLYQAAVRLLSYHIKSGPFRPSLVRDYLSKYLALFPQNSIFLSLYAWNERRLRIDDRVRTMLRDVVLVESTDNIISRLFSIRYEFQAGNVHSIHAAFENAVTSSFTSSNPGLWRLYIIFCTTSGAYRARAKDVFYRGMRACPWSKDLMMLAFTELRGIMRFEELRSVYRVLGEKELRIHVDLEERLEDADA